MEDPEATGNKDLEEYKVILYMSAHLWVGTHPCLYFIITRRPQRRESSQNLRPRQTKRLQKSRLLMRLARKLLKTKLLKTRPKQTRRLLKRKLRSRRNSTSTRRQRKRPLQMRKKWSMTGQRRTGRPRRMQLPSKQSTVRISKNTRSWCKCTYTFTQICVLHV